MRPSDTWVCVADGAKTHIFRCDGPGRDLEPVLDCSLAAERVAGQLDRAAADQLYRHLVLVGPAAVVGALRNSLGPQASGLVVGEVNKHLNRPTPREVGCHIQELLPH